MRASTLTLIIQLCQSAAPGEAGNCTDRATECVRYFGKESVKQIEKCRDLASNDASAQWAVREGHRKLEYPPFDSCPWSKKFWGLSKCPSEKEFHAAWEKANPDLVKMLGKKP